jgi:hypothetical protein
VNSPESQFINADFVDIFEMAQQYLDIGPDAVGEFVGFEYRLGALVWLHRSLRASVSAEVRELRKIRDSGSHDIFPDVGDDEGYFFDPALIEIVLGDTISVLEDDATKIGCGAIVAACASAVESLLAELLPPPESPRQGPRGLIRRARSLADRWNDVDKTQSFLSHVEWLAQRRNSFAHRLIDAGLSPDDPGAHFNFNDAMVEETFERVGEIVSILSYGYDEYSASS